MRIVLVASQEHRGAFGGRANALKGGHAASTASQLVAVFIAGREQPNTSRGLQLRDRYLP